MLQVKLDKPTPENSCLIDLGNERFAIVDSPVRRDLLAHKWYAVLWNFRWYAYSKRLLDGTPCYVAMHRLIANTQKNEVCHHANRNSLDNRIANLMNMSSRHHRELHKIRKFGRKKPVKTTIVRTGNFQKTLG